MCKGSTVSCGNELRRLTRFHWTACAFVKHNFHTRSLRPIEKHSQKPWNQHSPWVIERPVLVRNRYHFKWLSIAKWFVYCAIKHTTEIFLNFKFFILEMNTNGPIRSMYLHVYHISLMNSYQKFTSTAPGIKSFVCRKKLTFCGHRSHLSCLLKKAE